MTKNRKELLRVAMLLMLLPCLFLALPASAQQIKIVETKTGASYRGLSVVNDKIAWVSGTKGYVGITRDGGKTWAMQQVPGYEQLDFRSIYAFNDNEAVIANAGSPAYILKTTDGGSNWTAEYKNADSAGFIDGLCFWNQDEGIVYGDPIEGHLLLLLTSDGGDTWQQPALSRRPALEKGEASFAASGTALRCLSDGRSLIATGGNVSRLLVSRDKGKKWESLATPMLHGLASTGTFSVAAAGEDMIIVGGDYRKDSLCNDHVFISADGGHHWQPPRIPTRGYRECVEFINNKTGIAIGPTGTDISNDKGMHWQALSNDKGFHTLRKSRHGDLVLMAGSNGRVAIVTIDQ